MTDFKDTIYWQIYGDVFAFHKKYVEVKEDDEYWRQVICEASMLDKKYENLPEKEFAKQLILAVLDELDRLAKERRSDAEKI